MFSIRQKREIADAVHKILRATEHPELPAHPKPIRFKLHVQGAEPWSWADIEDNSSVEDPGRNEWERKAGPCRNRGREVRAGNLLERYGHKLIGKTVLTERCGEWPGGPAEIIQIKPDSNAPEIVLQVRHKTAANPLQPSRYWEIGIFDHENVELFATSK